MEKRFSDYEEAFYRKSLSLRKIDSGWISLGVVAIVGSNRST